ncbi:hypothetical protein KGO95_03910 [Patescibacteria group bacterium]|nr:hypothetical protein [Patescibacteria group bacterium]
MVSKKSISDLEDKAWYRFIKLVFVFALVFILGAFNIIVFSSGIKHVDLSKTVIRCNIGNKDIFTAESGSLSLEDQDFPQDEFDYRIFFDGSHDLEVGRILYICLPKNTFTDIYDAQKYEELENADGILGQKNTPISSDAMSSFINDYGDYRQQVSGLFGDIKTKYLDFSFNMFDIKPVFDYSGAPLFFSGNFIILIFFEIIRRSFYYVVLGSILPK